uniref:Uncharacterized protein n=1 Tax=Cacopsylla melanoneura TaxID=428564 RepID=A0A8D8YQB5_9HEMI
MPNALMIKLLRPTPVYHMFDSMINNNPFQGLGISPTKVSISIHLATSPTIGRAGRVQPRAVICIIQLICINRYVFIQLINLQLISVLSVLSVLFNGSICFSVASSDVRNSSEKFRTRQ